MLNTKNCFFFVNSTNVVNSTNRHWLVLQTDFCLSINLFQFISFFNLLLAASHMYVCVDPAVHLFTE